MADPLPYPDPSDDTGSERGFEPTSSTPRWVKAFGVIALVLVLLVGIVALTGGDSHGPGRHAPSNDSGGQTPPSSVTESGGTGGHRPPAGGHTP